VQGRIAKDAEPAIRSNVPAALQVDAQQGIAQLAFDRVADDLQQRAIGYGVAMLSIANSFTVGELGYYTRRCAQRGLVAFATCNATAQMTTLESGRAVYGTNPLSFAAPMAGRRPLVIDQASSATAFVNVRRAAQQGDPIPAGWAVDQHGQPTVDAREAVKGLLLAFGGARGAHVALMVEVLAAGMTGAHWSMDAPHYASGHDSPGVGLFLAAFHPQALVEGFEQRLADQIDRLAQAGVRIPGSHITGHRVEVAADVMDRVRAYVV
jgi:(2R)-3-sulfolactate dehydrogenase (NADP+)